MQENSRISGVYERNIFWAFALSIVTMGLYALYWISRLHTETYALCAETGRSYSSPERQPSPITVIILSIVTVGLYLVWWTYQQGKLFRDEARRRGSNEADTCPSLYPVLQLVSYLTGFSGVIGLALMQDRINQLLRMRGEGERAYDPDRFNHTPEQDIARRYAARAAEYEASLAEDDALQAALEGRRSQLFLEENSSPDAGGASGEAGSSVVDESSDAAGSIH